MKKKIECKESETDLRKRNLNDPPRYSRAYREKIARTTRRICSKHVRWRRNDSRETVKVIPWFCEREIKVKDGSFA